MTYNRMEAKPIAGEHCRFCGDAQAPLVKTPCCDQWICCDTAFLSFRGGGRCQVEHERFSLCYSHYEDKHGGPWQSSLPGSNGEIFGAKGWLIRADGAAVIPGVS